MYRQTRADSQRLEYVRELSVYFLNIRRNIIKMDLIGFYDANPAFFMDIFAPTFLGGISEGSFGLYLLTGLRGSCRAFARIVPRPRRAYLRHVCYRAVDEFNVSLCAHLIAKNSRLAAAIISQRVRGMQCSLEQLDARDDILCLTLPCLPRSRWWYTFPCDCSEKVIDLALHTGHIDAVWRRELLIPDEATISISDEAILSSRMPPERIMELRADFIKDHPTDAFRLALTSQEGRFVPILIDFFIEHKYSVFDRSLLRRISNCPHKRSLEFYRMVRARIPAEEYIPEIFELLSYHANEYSLGLLREMYPYVNPQWVHERYFRPNYEAASGRLDVYRFWDEKGYTDPGDMAFALQVATPESFEICEYLAERHPDYVRAVHLSDPFVYSIVASRFCGEKLSTLILAGRAVNITIDHLTYVIQHQGTRIDLCRRMIPLMVKDILRKNAANLKHLCVRQMPFHAIEFFDLLDVEVPDTEPISFRADLFRTMEGLPLDKVHDFLIFAEKRSADPIQRTDWKTILDICVRNEYYDIADFVRARLRS